ADRPLPDVRLNGRPLRTKQGPSPSRLEAIPLGPVNRLELVWKGPVASPQKDPMFLTSVERVTVHVHETSVVTEVELTLQARGGEVRQWQIQMPPQGVPEVREPRPQDPLLDGIDLPDQNNRLLTVRLKEPVAEPLRVVFQIRQARARAPLPVGPFLVRGALR